MFRAEIVTTKGTKDTKGGGEFDRLSGRVTSCALEVHPVPGMELLFVTFVTFVVRSDLQTRAVQRADSAGVLQPPLIGAFA